MLIYELIYVNFIDVESILGELGRFVQDPCNQKIYSYW